MADTNGTFADLSDDDDTQDINLDDLDNLPAKDPIVKNLCNEFTVEPTPSKILSRQSVSHNREHMKVYLRIRPFTGKEIDKGESQDTMKVDSSSSCLIMQAPKDSFAFKSSMRGFGDMSHKFTFTRIFGEETNQKSLFDDTMLATVKDFVDGQNCLVFTYGVTNAGKTYTIQGTPQDGGILPRALDVVFNSIEGRQFSNMRLKPRFFCDVVKISDRQLAKEEDIKRKVLSMAECEPPKHTDRTIDKSSQDMTQDSLAESDTSKASHYSTATEESVLSESGQDVSKLIDGIPNVWEDIHSRIPDDTSIDVEAQGPIKFSIWVSFAEIYNEYIYDLLEEIPKGKKARRQPLKLASDKHGSIYIKGLKEIQVDSADEAYRILKIGQNNRSIASTKLNQCSSRSHCIFSIKILRVVDVNDPHVARVSKLSFCDLAGSERYTKTHNTGERLKEAGNINTSLLTLGKCIHTLRYNQNHPKSNPKIIPFRESKLTRLFQSFFLGKGKAHMIVNVNQCASGFDETMHVLKFSAIAKQVTTVTSKLDNKWKELPRKLASARAMSMVINQSATAESSKNVARDNRPSIAWATPGTAKAVAEELHELDMIEESVLETEEEEDVDEEDIDMTPMGEKSTFEEDAEVVRWKKALDVLKSQLVQEKQKNLNLEMNLREEICQEMAQQIVQIEEDYNERLREEQEFAEEKFERKLELYAKSVKKANKRRKKDDDADDDEYVSSHILAAEQVKVQERDAKIEDLEDIIEKLKLESARDEDKMSAQNQTIMELQSLVESTKVTLEEANERLCTKETLLEQVQSDLDKYKETNRTQASDLEEERQRTSEMVQLRERVSNAESRLQDYNNTDAALNQKIAAMNQEIAALKQDVAEKEQFAKQAIEVVNTGQVEEVTNLKNELANLKNARVQASEADDEIKKLNSELSQKIEEREQALAKSVSNLKDRELQITELKGEVERAITQESELTAAKNVLETKLTTAEKEQAAHASLVEEKEAEIVKLSSNLARVEQLLKEAKDQIQKGDETTIFEADEQRIKMENFNEDLKKAEKARAELQGELAAAEEKQQSELTDLQSQLAHSQEQLKKSAEEVEQLQLKLKSMQEEGDEQIKTLMSQLESANKATTEVKSSKDRNVEALQRIKQEAEELSAEVNSLQEKLDSVSEEQEKTRAELETTEQKSQAKVNKLESSLKDTMAQLEESKEIIKNNSMEMDNLKGQIDKLQQNLEESTNASTCARKELERVQFKAQETEEAVKDGESVMELLKNQVKSVEGDLEKERMMSEELTGKVKELEETLADLQERYDEANETGREASGRLRNLEESLNKAKENLSAEQKAHEASKSAASGHEARISEMRISLEMSERTAASMAKQIRRTKEVEEELENIKKALAEKTQEADKLSNVSGDAIQMRTKVENLEEKLRTTEQQLGVTKQTLQETLSKCSSLEQSLESKKDSVRDQQCKIERMKEDLEAKSSEVVSLQENQTQRFGNEKHLEENCQRLEHELTSKTSTINMLMKKMEQKCQEVKTAQQQVKSTEKDLDTLKCALQEQEEAMAEQDKFLSSKEEDYKTIVEELEKLQEKYTTLMKTSSEEQKALRQAQRDLAKFTNDKSAKEKDVGARDAQLESAKKKEEELAKEVRTLKETLEETNNEVKDLEKELGASRTALTSKEEEMQKMQNDIERTQLELEKMQEQCERNQKELKERRKEVMELREKVENNDMEEIKKKEDLKDAQIYKLQEELEQQEAAKEEELAKWRQDKDTLLSALEEEMTKLREKEHKALLTLKDKETYIEQLKKEMLDHMSQSAAFTEDDESEEDQKRSTRKSTKSTRNARSKRASKPDLSESRIEESDNSEPVRTRRRRGRNAMQAVKEEPIVIEDSPVLQNEADDFKEESSIPKTKQQLIDEEPIYEEPPSDIYSSTCSSSDSGRQPSMVIMEPDETDSSRVEIDVTPLQKNTRKARNTRRGKKRKSAELLEEGKGTGALGMKKLLSFTASQFKKHGCSSTAISESQIYSSQDMESGTKKRGTARSTRGRRRTRAACKEESDESENQPTDYAADGPLPPPGRNSRKALSKIGDMFQNSPFGKSVCSSTNKSFTPSRTRTAKKLVDNIQSPKQSPPRTVEVSVYGTTGAETKKRRKLYKTEISTPYDCSPYEKLSQQVEGTKAEEPPRPVEPPPRKAEGIVTRKLRSRQKKN